jgi:hypothetical protein
MMFVITLKQAPATQFERSKINFKSSDLIATDQTAPDLSFVISYEAHPSADVFSFSVYCRQIQWIGGEGVGIPSKPLIDMIMPDILKKMNATDHVTSFLLKFIRVECHLCYVYASHCGLNEGFINLFKWASLFTNFSRLISIREQQLDDALNARLFSKWFGMCGDPLLEGMKHPIERVEPTSDSSKYERGGLGEFHPSKFDG